MSYLHGIELKEAVKTTELSAGDSSVIALVGTAPIGKVNEAVLITSKAAGVIDFGDDIGGFTIPAALDMIFSHVSAKVIVVNVLANADATALLTLGKMTKDAQGKWATNINEGVLPEATDFASEIIAGLELLTGVPDSIGIKPDMVIAPGYSQLQTVMAKMITIAEKLNGFAIVDVARTSTVQAVLTARNTGNYASANASLMLAFPHVYRYNSHEKENQLIGFSVCLAISKVATDSTLGFWISPSNFEISSILGTDIDIISSLVDPAADTNLLNGAGIVTVLRRPGSGYRVWGNWTAAFPTEKGAEVMIAPRSVRLMIREVLIDAAIRYLDRNNITKLTVEMVQNDVNAFLRGLIGKGAINAGNCSWDSEKNPAAEISQGKLLYTISVTYGPSLDSLTFEEVVDTNYNL